mgnify:CR=1 FL=1
MPHKSWKSKNNKRQIFQLHKHITSLYSAGPCAHRLLCHLSYSDSCNHRCSWDHPASYDTCHNNEYDTCHTWIDYGTTCVCRHYRRVWQYHSWQLLRGERQRELLWDMRGLWLGMWLCMTLKCHHPKMSYFKIALPKLLKRITQNLKDQYTNVFMVIFWPELAPLHRFGQFTAWILLGNWECLGFPRSCILGCCLTWLGCAVNAKL